MRACVCGRRAGRTQSGLVPGRVVVCMRVHVGQSCRAVVLHSARARVYMDLHSACVVARVLLAALHRCVFPVVLPPPRETWDNMTTYTYLLVPPSSSCFSCKISILILTYKNSIHIHIVDSNSLYLIVGNGSTSRGSLHPRQKNTLCCVRDA